MYSCSREKTFLEGGWGACGYLSQIRRSHSALTMGLRNVVLDFSLFLGFAKVTERGIRNGQGYVVEIKSAECALAILFSMVC